MREPSNDLWTGGPWEQPSPSFPTPPAVVIPSRRAPLLRPKRRRKRRRRPLFPFLTLFVLVVSLTVGTVAVRYLWPQESETDPGIIATSSQQDPFAALELCKELGVDTVLTSGQKNTCLEGLPLLEELWPRRGGVELLLGAGISAAAIRRIRESLPQARAFHMSGKITVESPMSYRKGDVSMGLPGFDEYTLWRTDPENLRAARKELME